MIQSEASLMLGPPANGVGIRGWLSGALRAAIAEGRLRPGSQLPATRTLAEDLGISRGSVVAAYEELTDEGLLTARVGAGTVVAQGVAAVPGAGRVGDPPAGLERTWRDTSDVRMDLTPGMPDLSAFPRAQWLRALRVVMDGAATLQLGYPHPRGDLALRTHLAAWLARTRGLRADPDDVIVTSGVAQGVALLAEVLRRRGATSVGVEDPGSRGLREQLAHWGLEPHAIPVDEHGLVTEDLGDQPAVLVAPAHQFPTGVVLSAARRHSLVGWAARTGGLVIEDDYDAEHRYDRPPVRAIQSLAPELVAHVGSVSKTLAPGLRLGWLIAPRMLQPDLLAHKDASDHGTPVLEQQVLAELIRCGAFERHLRQMRPRLRRRRDALLAGLGPLVDAGAVQGAAAGMHLLLTLPAGTDERAVTTALVTGHSIRVEPLAVHQIRPGPPGLVMGYGAHTPDRLQFAGLVMARAIAHEGLAR